MIIEQHTPAIIALMPLILGILGILIAYLCYIVNPNIPISLAQSMKGVYRFLLNAWYFDKLYDVIIIRPYAALSKALWKIGEKDIIQEFPVILAQFTNRSAKGISWIQNGSFALYAFTMAIGLVVIVATFLIYQ